MYQIKDQNIILYKKDVVPDVFSDENYSTMSRRQYFKVVKGRNGTGYMLVNTITRPDIIAKIEEKFGPIPAVPAVDSIETDYEAENYYLSKNLPLSLVDKYTKIASFFKAMQYSYKESEAFRKTLGKKINKSAFYYSQMLKFNDQIIDKTYNNIRSFERAFTNYLNQGYDSIISGNVNNTNSLKNIKEVKNLLDRIFAHQAYKPNPTEVSEQYNAFICGNLELGNPKTGELYNPAHFPFLSKSAITTYLAEWESKIATHQIRKNDRQKTLNMTKPYHSMSLPKYANSLVSVDDRQPPFEYESGRRLWFYNCQDVASGAVTAWVYGKDKKGIILDFYRQMVRNCAEWNLGLPLEIEAEMNLNSELIDGFLKEGEIFEYVNIAANSARSKYIEGGFNKAVRYKIEKKYEGWKARPHAILEANRGDNQSNIKDIDYIKTVALQAIEEWNNQPSTQDSSLSRFEYFIKNQNPNIKPINWHKVLKYIGRTTDTSCRNGRVKLNKQTMFIALNSNIVTGDKLIKILEQIEGHDIIVKWLDDNNSQMLKSEVYYKDRLICELMPEPLYCRARAEQSDIDIKNKAIQSAYSKTIESYGKERKKEVEKIIVIDNRKTTISDSFKISELHQQELIIKSTLIPPIEDEPYIPEEKTESIDYLSAF